MLDRCGSRRSSRSPGLPGARGAVESRALLALLSEQGYDGPVTAEPMAQCAELAGLDDDAAARLVIGSLRRVWPD